MAEKAPDLELSEEEMRGLVARAMDRIVAHVATLAAQPAADVAGAAEVARSLAEPRPPEAGVPFSEILSLLFDKAIPTSFNSAGPGYLAYIPGGGLFASAVADLISDSVNRYTGVWAAAPALVQLEANVIRWFCAMVGYSQSSGGILTSGGSLANFSAVVAARTERLGEDFLRGTAYASWEAHHSVGKAMALAGFPASAFRQIPVDSRFRIEIDELRAAVRSDRERGLEPFLVVANAGSTSTGAVDDLVGLAELCAEEALWLHVDGAYGGFFLLTERGQEALSGIDRADSVVLDPHKGLFLPYGTGCLVVKDQGALLRSHRSVASYLPELHQGEGFVDFCELSPELSRAFRGLRAWLPLKLHGIAPFRRQLDEKLDLAREATEGLRRIPGIEIVAEPQLTVTAFRLRRPGLPRAETDSMNRELLARVNSLGRVHLSGTTLPLGFVLRVCILSYRTHMDRVLSLLEDVAREAASL